GGGYIIVTDKAGGEKAPDVGSKNNFGFNVKFNKKGTNLQGHINTIIRRTETGIWDDNCDGIPDAEEPYTMVRNYQVKGNAMTSLTTTGSGVASGSNPRMATYFGKASISDVTGDCSVPVQGNTTLRVDIIDKGEPGTADEIGIVVWNKDGGVWYVANWSGSQSQKQLLDGGNVVVHTSSGTRAAETIAEPAEGGLQLIVANNPATGGTNFKVQLRSDDPSTPINVRVMNMSGIPMQTERNLYHGATIEFGSAYTKGMYFVEAIQGDQRKVIKLLKQ
ncbi:MAG TPA: T9SS type A sorting domain-containing protein, partial [Phnomibacter sp.]|nr:T9SS type A sorting domain-containing protein [Phnomibacter sp.]